VVLDIPQRDTVAGEAAARSPTSNIIDIEGLIAMISEFGRQSFLLSSSTVFMFSIQMASTGPSSTHLHDIDKHQGQSLVASRAFSRR
jgi:hypothetical protein